MEEKENMTIPFVALESERARCERMMKEQLDRHQKERHDERLKSFVIILVLILLLFGTNAGWLAYESQWETVETVTQEVTQEADNGINRFIGGDYYGEADGKDN